MGYTFTVGDVERICHSLGMQPARKGSSHWVGIGLDGTIRRTKVDSHGLGREIATGTARRIARQLGFSGLKEMHEYLQKIGRRRT